MFEAITERMEGIFKKLRGFGKLTEKNIQEALREVRRAFLEADVNYRVARDFIAGIERRALGQEVLGSLTPAQQLIKIVHEELTHLLGESQKGIVFSSTPPTVIIAVGLQGSGKTTACAKLARHFKGRRSLLVPADPYRPAARDQLKVLGTRIGVPVFEPGREGQPPIQDPVELSRGALAFARKEGFDLLIVDTAGRLHIDDQMMSELKRMREVLTPAEVLLVADGMTGQDAVNIAQEFNRQLDVTGVILTKLDGDARGGAALSFKAVTGKPIKFLGVGEDLHALEVFHPERVASRILGMGDVLSLIEKAEETFEQEKAVKLQEKIRKASLTFEDFLEQLQQIRKMGPLEDLLHMIPGLGSQIPKGLVVDEKAIGRAEAIIGSMTRKERETPSVIDGSRRKRIAMGSGTSVQEVNRLLRDFEAMQKMMRQMSLGALPKKLLGLKKR